MGALLKNEQDTRSIEGWVARGGRTPKSFSELGGPRR